MSSLINNAMSGLAAAQAALNSASNNISSYNVAGYTRQTTIMAQANSTLGAGGWVGNGVYVSGVQREYDSFITNQLRAAQNQSSGLTTRYEQMSKIDNLLSSKTSSISTSMQDFFTSLQTLVSNAEDPAARQALHHFLAGATAEGEPTLTPRVDVREEAERLYEELATRGIEVALDDRGLRPGPMFADAELIGIPQRIVIGERGLATGTFEYRRRDEAENRSLSRDALLALFA